MPVKPVPAGYRSVTPYLAIAGAAQAIEFYKKAFGAEEVSRLSMPDGSVAHAEIKIGDSMVMLGDENIPMGGNPSPTTLKGTPTGLLIYLADVDAAFKRAVEAGAKVKAPLENQFWGDRYGKVVDPFGHEWSLATHIEDVSPEEMEQRMAAMT